MAIKLTTTKRGADHAKVLVYSPSGYGKTTLAGTAPKPVIISSEKKLIALKEQNIPVILIENHEDLQEAYELVTGPKGGKFETVVVDSISDIAETLLSFFKKNPVDGNTHPQAAYGCLADELGPLIKKFRDISDKHVYFIAKCKMVEDEYTNVNMFTPSMPGRVLATGLPYEFDYVLALRIGETKSGKKYRYLQTEADIQWLAKGDNCLSPMEEPNLTKLFNKVLGKTTKQEPAPKDEKEEDSQIKEDEVRDQHD